MTWTDLGDGIRVRQSKVYAMNSVVLEHEEHTVIVDPGVLPSELDDLALGTRGVSAATTLFFTHGDWDHVLGRPWWPGAPVVAHDTVAAEVRRDREAIQREAERAALEHGERWERGFQAFRPDEEVSGLHFDKIGPWRVVYRSAPGHSASMLTIHLPEDRVLIAGDMLSDLEIPMLAQPAALYRRTLDELEPLARHGAIETLIPGHGSIAEGRDAVLARIARDRRYLDQLEQGVREALAAGRSADTAEPPIGPDALPEGGLTPFLAEAHRRNIGIAFAAAAGPGARRPR